MLIKQGECFMMCLDISYHHVSLSDSFDKRFVVNKTGAGKGTLFNWVGFLKEIQMKYDKKKKRIVIYKISLNLSVNRFRGITS